MRDSAQFSRRIDDPEHIRNVAKRIVETQRDDCRVVAIISAMAGVTDNLIKLAHDVSADPDKRELDVLPHGER